MPAKASFNPKKIRNQKRAIGAIAITLLLLFTVLYFLGRISFLVWILADLVTAALANLLLRRIGRTPV